MARSPVTLDALSLVIIVAVGLVAGVLGGLLGVGGSVIMIPGLALALHPDDPESQHLFQASAMAVNIAVAFPAALRHRRAGVVRGDVFRILLPSAAVAIVAGVLLSNLVPGQTLKRFFAVFLLYVAVTELWKIARRRPDHAPAQAPPAAWKIIATGGAMGLVAGLLGVGGGVIAVPMMLALCRLPVKHAIGLSSAVMCLTAAVGASIKIGTIHQHGFDWKQAAILAVALAPTAVLGGHLGAVLTHRLPLQAVRVALCLLLLFSAGAMAA